MFQKLQLNFSFLFITLVLLVSGGQVFAQDSSESPGNSQAPKEAQLEENHDTKDLEKLLKNYNTDAEKVLKDANTLHQEEAGQEVDVSDMKDMRPDSNPNSLGVVTQNAFEKVQGDREEKKLLDQKNHSDYSGAVRLALVPLQKLSEKELMKLFEENSRNSPMRPYMDKFPSSVVFAIKLVRDPESLPSIAKIAENKDKLIYFSGVMLATIIFGFFLKKLMYREGSSFIRLLINFIMRMFIMLALRIYIIYYFYSTELTPAAKIFKITFM